MPQGLALRANTLEGRWQRTFPGCALEHLFDIASNIEAYPGFIPGCVATRILRKPSESVWIVDNIFGFGPVRTRFATKAVVERPRRLSISSNDGPWQDFSLVWEFAELEGQATVFCRFSLEFRSALLNQMARICAPEIERQVIKAFEKRALCERA